MLMSRYAEVVELEIQVVSVVYCPLARLYPALSSTNPTVSGFTEDALNHVSDKW